MTNNHFVHPFRYLLVIMVVMSAMLFLVWRAFDLQIMNKDFLQGEGDARYLRDVRVVAHRGMILDRHGEPLAISTPVDSVWVNPQDFSLASKQQRQLVKKLKISNKKITELLAGKYQHREFIYLKRHVSPDMAKTIMAMGIQGVSLQREYRRYYPAGEVASHIIGFTNVDDKGQEGIELAYDQWLRGQGGKKRVLKDRLGRVVENIENIRAPSPGKPLYLSIDRRLQYLAYRELKAAVKRNKAKSGSLVMLDVKTGEVLAMVNQPSYNPNNRAERKLKKNFRNRSVTDVLEPGSTIKPFIVAAALESRRFRPATVIDTSPGLMRVDRDVVKDIKNYGRIDLGTIIQKSSNVGAAKVALKLESEMVWDVLSRVSFGYKSTSGFPGESSGLLPHYADWRKITQATISFGYGLSVTPLQLARAYAALGGDGFLRPVSFLKTDTDNSLQEEKIFEPEVVSTVRRMMEKVVAKGGTGTKAYVAGYRVAGKTGTMKKSGVGGYTDDYTAIFAGVAPASNPRIAMVVVVDEPGGDEYYGGAVAAPVFSQVASGALRLLNVTPDDIPSLGTRMARLEDKP